MTKIRVMDDRLFNECIVRYECSKLDSIHRAIEKWEDVAVAQWNANSPDTSGMDEYQAHWAASHFNDQAYMMHVTKQSMLGSLAVTMASSVENFFGALCEDREITLGDRAGWGQKRQRLETDLGVQFNTLPGIQEVTKVRLLGNCFKHNEGKKDAELVAECGGVVDEEIDFDAENWPNLIAATRQFLLAVVEHT